MATRTPASGDDDDAGAVGEPSVLEPVAVEDDEELAAFLAAWEQLGREAIGALEAEPRALRVIMRDCQALIVHQLWAESGRCVTEVATLSSTSRRRVRGFLKHWFAAQGLVAITRPGQRTQYVRPRRGNPGSEGAA